MDTGNDTGLRAASDAQRGIDVDGVTAWFVSHLDAEAPLAFTLIAGGRSNLTYRVEDRRGNRWALRRPPLGPVLATAHDVGREQRIISALAGTDVAVPASLGFCDDLAVTGAPFAVMEFVDGVVVRDIPIAESLSLEQRAAASRSVVDALAAIHAVDIDAVGLGSLAKRDHYIERQLKRWSTQYAASRSCDVAAVERAHELLRANIPPPGPPGIVHGDFRLDNCIVRDDGSVAAVLDWELCTLGDVLADVGQMLVYWVEPGEDGALESPPTSLPGFLTRAEVVDRYAAATGRDLAPLDFYVAFASWKVACILDGVHKRYAQGAMGEAVDGDFLDSYRRRIESLAARAEQVAARL